MSVNVVVTGFGATTPLGGDAVAYIQKLEAEGGEAAAAVKAKLDSEE